MVRMLVRTCWLFVYCYAVFDFCLLAARFDLFCLKVEKVVQDGEFLDSIMMFILMGFRILGLEFGVLEVEKVVKEIELCDDVHFAGFSSFIVSCKDNEKFWFLGYWILEFWKFILFVDLFLWVMKSFLNLGLELAVSEVFFFFFG